jgi:L-arabinose isomerase
MARMDGEKLVHIDLSITVSENDYSYYDPKVYKQISFTIPIEMFSVQELAKMIDKRMKELEKAFPDVKAKYEAELKEKEEKEAREKAAKESAELTTADLDALLSK